MVVIDPCCYPATAHKIIATSPEQWQRDGLGDSSQCCRRSRKNRRCSQRRDCVDLAVQPASTTKGSSQEQPQLCITSIPRAARAWGRSHRPVAVAARRHKEPEVLDLCPTTTSSNLSHLYHQREPAGAALERCRSRSNIGSEPSPQ
jgi:hypothetical protein